MEASYVIDTLEDFGIPYLGVTRVVISRDDNGWSAMSYGMESIRPVVTNLSEPEVDYLFEIFTGHTPSDSSWIEILSRHLGYAAGGEIELVEFK